MKTILIPFDFSENARKALEYAMQLAKVVESNLYLYHVLHESPYKLATATNEQEMEKLIKKDEDEKTRALKEEIYKALLNLKISFPSEKIKAKAEYNPLIVEKIISVAKELDADLIVMGTHGASGIKKFFFGSNTSNMIARSEIPVLAIPQHFGYSTVRTILYASDLENPEAELNRLIPFARSVHAGIDLLHFDYGPDEIKKTDEEVAQIIKKTGYLDIRLVKQTADVEVPLLKQIRHFMEINNPQWLVMFTRERSMWDKLFIGSKTEDMANTLKLPLLSFKKPD